MVVRKFNGQCARGCEYCTGFGPILMFPVVRPCPLICVFVFSTSSRVCNSTNTTGAQFGVYSDGRHSRLTRTQFFMSDRSPDWHVVHCHFSRLVFYITLAIASAIREQKQTFLLSLLTALSIRNHQGSFEASCAFSTHVHFAHHTLTWFGSLAASDTKQAHFVPQQGVAVRAAQNLCGVAYRRR